MVKLEVGTREGGGGGRGGGEGGWEGREEHTLLMTIAHWRVSSWDQRGRMFWREGGREGGREEGREGETYLVDDHGPLEGVIVGPAAKLFEF